MPGRLPLTRVAAPAFSCAIRAWRAAATLIPACPAMTVTAAPAGSADRAARTAAAGLSPAAGATGTGAGTVAVSAALRAAWGAGFLVRAMAVTPFLFPGAIPVFICLHRCFLDDDCSGPAVKSSGSAAIPVAVFRPRPGGLGI
jgi:hypothetical protein